MLHIAPTREALPSLERQPFSGPRTEHCLVCNDIVSADAKRCPHCRARHFNQRRMVNFWIKRALLTLVWLIFLGWSWKLLQS